MSEQPAFSRPTCQPSESACGRASISCSILLVRRFTSRSVVVARAAPRRSPDFVRSLRQVAFSLAFFFSPALSHPSRREFYCQKFYCFLSIILRFLLKKVMHWHRSPAMVCWCLSRLFFWMDSGRKKSFLLPRCECRLMETEHTHTS